MDVLADHFVVFTGVTGEVAELHVFAHGGDELGHVFAHQALQGFGVGGVAVQHALGHLGGQGFELFAASHEVGLAQQGGHGHGLAVSAHGGHHQAFAGGTAGLLGSLGHTLLAQPVDGLFQVAVHFHQGFLAVHHAGAGLFAQFLHHSGGNSHCILLCIRPGPEQDSKKIAQCAGWRHSPKAAPPPF